MRAKIVPTKAIEPLISGEKRVFDSALTALNVLISTAYDSGRGLLRVGGSLIDRSKFTPPSGDRPDGGNGQKIDPGHDAAASRIEVLFREHNETLVRFLRGRLPSDVDAREAAQEAYVRLLQLDEPAQPSFLRAYLFKVAANVATDLLRRRVMRQRGDMAAVGSRDQAAPATQERALQAREQL